MLILLLVGFASQPAVAQAPPTTCDRSHNGLAVVVNLDNELNAGSIAHVREAVAAGKHRVLHIARALAQVHRAQSLRGVPTRTGFDRDEYPPAASAEGGTGADIDYVRSSDNRSAGSRMKVQLTGYCEGQAFILEP